MKRRSIGQSYYVGFIINYFSKMGYGGVIWGIEVTYCHIYFQHIIDLWHGYWVEVNLRITNEFVGQHNQHQK